MGIYYVNPPPPEKKANMQPAILLVCLLILIGVLYLIAVHYHLIEPCCEPAYVCCELSLDFNFGVRE